MASLGRGTRSDGSNYLQVLHRLNGKHSSTSFEDLASATKFQKLVDKFGPANALEALGMDPEFSAMTVHESIEHHIDHLTGLRKSSLYDYRSVGVHTGDFAHIESWMLARQRGMGLGLFQASSAD